MIEHLHDREKSLEPFGWRGCKAEWIALVCLHSGGVHALAILPLFVPLRRWIASAPCGLSATSWVEAWQPKAGVPMPRVIVVNQQKRWGSCDQRGTIRLNWRIIQAPMQLIDYVVAHELVHLRHRGHGGDYWQAIGRIMPDYERRREELRGRGIGLAW